MNYGEYLNAGEVYDEICNLVTNLPREDQENYADFLFIPELRLSLMKQENDGLRQVLFDANRDEVEEFAALTNCTGHIEAQKLMEEYTDSLYRERILLPNPFYERSVTHRTREGWKPKFTDLLKVTPNPANIFIDVEYAFVNEIPTEIEILSSQGSVIKSMAVSTQLGKIRISIASLVPGNYHVRAGHSAKTFVIIR